MFFHDRPMSRPTCQEFGFDVSKALFEEPIAEHNGHKEFPDWCKDAKQDCACDDLKRIQWDKACDRDTSWQLEKEVNDLRLELSAQRTELSAQRTELDVVRRQLPDQRARLCEDVAALMQHNVDRIADQEIKQQECRRSVERLSNKVASSFEREMSLFVSSFETLQKKVDVQSVEFVRHGDLDAGIKQIKADIHSLVSVFGEVLRRSELDKSKSPKCRQLLAVHFEDQDGEVDDQPRSPTTAERAREAQVAEVSAHLAEAQSQLQALKVQTVMNRDVPMGVLDSTRPDQVHRDDVPQPVSPLPTVDRARKTSSPSPSSDKVRAAISPSPRPRSGLLPSSETPARAGVSPSPRDGRSLADSTRTGAGLPSFGSRSGLYGDSVTRRTRSPLPQSGPNARLPASANPSASCVPAGPLAFSFPAVRKLPKESNGSCSSRCSPNPSPFDERLAELRRLIGASEGQ
jgi:ribosomal protein L29